MKKEIVSEISRFLISRCFLDFNISENFPMNDVCKFASFLITKNSSEFGKKIAHFDEWSITYYNMNKVCYPRLLQYETYFTVTINIKNWILLSIKFFVYYLQTVLCIYLLLVNAFLHIYTCIKTSTIDSTFIKHFWVYCPFL